MEHFDTFGQLIRRFRQERGETLAELAENIAPLLPDEGRKISVAMLSRIETDDRSPSPKVATALAEYFGIPAEDAIALLAIAKTSRQWASSASRTDSLMEPHAERFAASAAMAADRSDILGADSASESMTSSGVDSRQALRDAATRVRAAASVGPRDPSTFPYASGEEPARREPSRAHHDLNDMLDMVDIAVRQLERTTQQSPPSPSQRRRLARRATDLSTRLGHVFGDRWVD